MIGSHQDHDWASPRVVIGRRIQVHPVSRAHEMHVLTAHPVNQAGQIGNANGQEDGVICVVDDIAGT